MSERAVNIGLLRGRRLGALLLGAWLGAALPSWAQATPEEAGPARTASTQTVSPQPAPDTLTAEQRDYMATLDRFLAAQDYNSLAAQILKPEISAHLKPALDWTRTGTMSGRSIIVPLVYASLLWELGVNYPQFADFKTSSGIVALYALLVAHADGPKCADPTAPSHRIEMIGKQYRKQFETIAALPDDKRRRAINAAIDMERTTAELRANDKYLCRFGVQETLDILQKHQGEKLKETTPKSDFAGFEIELPLDANYEPSFLPREQWAKKQAALRAGFSKLLASFVATYKQRAAQAAPSTLPQTAPQSP